MFWPIGWSCQLFTSIRTELLNEHTLRVIETVVLSKVDIPVVAGPFRLQLAARLDPFLVGTAVEPGVDSHRGADVDGAANSGVVDGNIALVNMLLQVRQPLGTGNGKRIYQLGGLREGSKAQGSEAENLDHFDWLIRDTCERIWGDWRRWGMIAW